MRELRPGLWHWTTFHDGIGAPVSSYYVEPVGALIDAREPDGGIDAAFAGRPAPQQAIVTSGLHMRHADRFAEAFGIPDAYGDQHRMLARADIDAVYIANAAALHRGSAVAALQAGKAVLCEKPLALDSAGGAQVAAAARRADRLCMEGLWTLFLPAYQRFIALAESQSCGAPGHLSAGFGSPEEAGGRLMSPDAGGVLLDRGVYLAPAMYEAGFVSAAHTADDIERTVAAAREALSR